MAPPGRKPTVVSTLFKDVAGGDLKIPKVKCNFCGTMVTKNGSRMKAHIGKCKNCTDDIKHKYLKSSNTDSTVISMCESQGPQGNSAGSSMDTKLKFPREGNLTPLFQPNSQGSSDQDLDTFVDIDIKHEPCGPGIELFDEAMEPSQYYDAPTTSNSNHSYAAPPSLGNDDSSAAKPKKKLSAKKQEAVVDEVLRLALNELKKSSAVERRDEEEKDDVCMAFGQMVASELRLMKPMQKIVAKKLINEVIFYGSLGSLQPSSAVMANLNSVEFDRE